MRKYTFAICSLIFCLSLYAEGYESPTLTLDAKQYKEIEKHFAEKQTMRKRHSDWAGFQPYREANFLQEKPVDVVFMGNSITDSWVNLHPDFFIDNNFVGRGISGQTTSQMLVRFQADVIALQPKMVVILAGTNDIARNNGYISHEHILQNIKSMCELAIYHDIQPVVCSILPAHRFKWNRFINAVDEIKAMNELIEAYADENNIPFVNYYNALVDDRGGLPAELAPDGVHPNKEGYDIMEAIVLKVIQSCSKR